MKKTQSLHYQFLSIQGKFLENLEVCKGGNILLNKTCKNFLISALFSSLLIFLSNSNVYCCNQRYDDLKTTTKNRIKRTCEETFQTFVFFFISKYTKQVVRQYFVSINLFLCFSSLYLFLSVFFSISHRMNNVNAKKYFCYMKNMRTIFLVTYRRHDALPPSISFPLLFFIFPN